MSRLGASDVDGTLLDHHGRLPDGRADAERRRAADLDELLEELAAKVGTRA